MPRPTVIARASAALAFVLLIGSAPAHAAPVDSVPPVDSADLEFGPQSTGVPGPADPAPGAGAARTAAAAVDDSVVASRLTSRSAGIAPAFSGHVVDVASEKVVWTDDRLVPRRPASTMKVLTGFTALRTFGTNHRFATTVHQGASWRHHVFLEGSGDPTLSTYRLRLLADSTASRLKTQGIRSINLRVDDSLFPAPRNAQGWESSDVPTWVAPVRALVVDQGNQTDTSMAAAATFAAALRAKGITVTDTRRGTTPGNAVTVASRQSPVLRTIVADMLRVSQNDYAEALLWASGMKAGAPRTWGGVTNHLRATVVGWGVTMPNATVRDGSGLSRDNRIAASTLTTLLSKLHRHSVYRGIVFADGALPVAGRTGTLVNRYRTAPTNCAAGAVRAKTGSLRDVSALAGVATDGQGRVRAFAFLASGRDNSAALRGQIDVLAATVTTCM